MKRATVEPIKDEIGINDVVELTRNLGNIPVFPTIQTTTSIQPIPKLPKTPKIKNESMLSEDKIRFLAKMYLKSHTRALIQIDGVECILVKQILDEASLDFKKELKNIIKDILISKHKRNLFEFWEIDP
jgi:hypothetical protein